MKKVFTLTLLLMVAGITMSFGQNKNTIKKVSKFKAGTVLTKTDVGFLGQVTSQAVTKSRGATEDNTVTVGETKLKAGQKLSEADAAVVKDAVTTYQKDNKGEKKAVKKPKTRGKDTCYYYYYCDYDGYCYYYYVCD